MKPCFVYRVTRQETGDSYIGISVTPKQRWSQHKTDAKTTPKGHFHKALAKYGAEAFSWEIVRELPSRQAAQLAEICFIYLEEPTYNLTVGGDGGWEFVVAQNIGKKHSPERLEKMSAAQRGKKHTPEACARMSVSRTGLKRSAEAIRKTAAANRGQKRSPETCEKLAAVNRGRKATPEARANQSAARLGKKRPPEFGAQVSARNIGNQYGKALKGRKKSPEAVVNMRLAQQARRLRERVAA